MTPHPGRFATHRRCAAWALRVAPALLVATSASAALLQGPMGGTEQGRRVVVAAPVESQLPAAQPISLVPAVLDAVDAKAGRIGVAHQQLPVHPTALRVLAADGQPLAGGLQALRAGQAVRLALEPTGAVPRESTREPPRERRVLLIQLERRP